MFFCHDVFSFGVNDFRATVQGKRLRAIISDGSEKTTFFEIEKFQVQAGKSFGRQLSWENAMFAMQRPGIRISFAPLMEASSDAFFYAIPSSRFFILAIAIRCHSLATIFEALRCRTQ